MINLGPTGDEFEELKEYGDRLIKLGKLLKNFGLRPIIEEQESTHETTGESGGQSEL